MAQRSDATVFVAASSGSGTFYQADPARRNIGLQAKRQQEANTLAAGIESLEIPESRFCGMW